ncbi:MAG: 23S rRNA (uracil(1939)-C(5))-methyltransferase RlmD [Francisellaceae bacterium]
MRRKKKSLPQGEFETEIVAMSHEGRGIARVEGKTVFIPFALPHEVVRFEYTHVSKNYDEGRLIDVVNPSSERVTPPCSWFENCGGCALQHVDPKAQIAFKQNTLMDHFKHFGHGVSPDEVLPPLLSENTEGYRGKARLGVRFVTKKNRVLVGFRERNGRFLADIDSCQVLDPRVGQKIIELQKLIADLSIYSHIPQIEVAVDDDHVGLVIRHLEPFTADDFNVLKDFAIAHDFWIYLQAKGPETVYLFYPEADVEPVQMSYFLDDFDISIHFEPGDFTQVNRRLNQKMVAYALDLLALKSDDRVLDLFCGLGNFSLPLARRCQSVTGVEGDEAMTTRAAINARNNGLHNIDFYAANLFEDIAAHRWVRSAHFTKMLLDPPRAGAEMVCRQIEKIAPERIVYVSCDPATLARDAGILVNEKGYRLLKAGVMDMFPHTTHVESIAVFEIE